MPKAGLSHDLVVREAAQVADDVGWENLTLAAVAQRLGVSMPALYKHIGSLDGLRHDVAVLAFTELAESLTEAVKGTSGQDALFALADAYRAYGQHHPGRYTATLRAPSWIDAEHSSAARAVLRVTYSTLEGYGLAGRDAADAVRAVRATLHGFVSLEAGGGFGTPLDLDRGYRRLIAGLDSTLAHWVHAHAGPSAGPASGSAP
jgi:AcrR family transcriptional regulator